jgi:sec-independent protein translocase protein TatC
MANGILMTFLQHFREFQKRLVRIGATFFVFFAIMIMFRLDTAPIGGFTVPYLYPDIFNAVAIQFFKFLYVNVAPPFAVAPPAVLAPAEGIMVEMKIAMFLALALSMPMIVYQMGRFLAPALRPKEKKLLMKTAVPATILFVTGAVFAYLFVLEFMFDFLYNIGIAMVTYIDPATGLPVAVAYLSIEQFIDFTLMVLIAFGLAFELPIIMVGLSAIGIVKPSFWKKNWRYATAGVTMLLVALPMLFLYVGGYFVSKRVVAKKAKAQ